MARSQPVVINGRSMGADPEAFIVDKDGAVIGSERIVPVKGLFNSAQPASAGYKPLVVRDGIQVEFHPQALACRQQFATSISNCINTLSNALPASGIAGARISLEGVVQVSRAELNALSPKSREFGCQPSLNIYKLSPQQVDPLTYLYRAAGGHFHFTTQAPIRTVGPNSVDHRVRVIQPMDILAGNLGVIFDSNPLQAERRKSYGMAGEYRLPTYGVEYRTLSNFWLRDYVVLSLFQGLCRQAIAIVEETLKPGGENLEEELINLVDQDDIVRAIQTNDVNLAMKNWQAVRKFIKVNFDVADQYYCAPLIKSRLDKFDHLLEEMATKGIDQRWPLADTVDKWNKFNINAVKGWEAWMADYQPPTKVSGFVSHMQKVVSTLSSPTPGYRAPVQPVAPTPAAVPVGEAEIAAALRPRRPSVRVRSLGRVGSGRL